MAYPIRTIKTATGMWVGSVDTKAYGQGYSVHRTAEFADRGEAYRTAEAWRTENSAKNAAAKADKNSAQMTCQCCGRAHLANTGKMAHHGYERPGYGWQTASCYGARHLPFQVSRDALGSMIALLKDRKGQLIEAQANVKAENGELSVTFADPDQKRDVHSGKRPQKTVYVTRGFFAEVMAANAVGFRSIGISSFDQVKDAKLSQIARNIVGITTDIADQQVRFNGWVQTHTWDKAAKVWSPLPKGR